VRGIGERALRLDIGSRQGLRRFFSAILTFGCLVAAACARPPASADDVVVEWKVVPSAPIVHGEASAEIRVLDRVRQPLRGARLRLEAHMNHPGMAPVIEPLVKPENGVYRVRVRFPMAGVWVLFVKGELADGRRLDERAGELTVGV
jgi:hypothetical protein